MISTLIKKNLFKRISAVNKTHFQNYFIMKVIISFFTVFFSIVVGTNGRLLKGDGNKNSGLPVQIFVKCTGLDVNKLEQSSKTIVSQVLEEAYGEVKETKNNRSTIKVTGEDSWRCGSLCPKPDDDELVDEENEGGDLYFNAFWRCGSLCPKPDDDELGAGISDTHMKAWEKKFVNGLIHTRRSEYRSVEHCSFIMSPADSKSFA